MIGVQLTVFTSILGVIAIAVISCATTEATEVRYFPLEDGEVAPWEQAAQVCRAQAVQAYIGAGKNHPGIASLAAHRACMGEYGWIAREVPKQ